MPTPDIAALLKQPPERIIELFRAKANKPTWDWQDMWGAAHAKAFTVAKAIQADVLQDLRQAVDLALTDGQTLREFQKGLEPKLREKGWWGKVAHEGADGQELVQLGSPWRLATIYRTNLRTGYMAGRYQQQKENAESRPYWQYIALPGARPEHAAQNGKVFAHDDPFWTYFYPPNGWGCRCRVRALSERRLEAKGLEVETGGRIETERVLVSAKTGETRPAKYYRAKDGTIFRPDPSWDHNPGKAAAPMDLGKYDEDIAAMLAEAIALMESK